jgi:hypothetical protein
LPIEELSLVTTDMGISIEENDFDTFDLLKNLEIARNELYQKQVSKNSSSQPETGETVDKDDEVLCIER